MAAHSGDCTSAQRALAVLIDHVDEDRQAPRGIGAVSRILSSASREAECLDHEGAGKLHGWAAVVKACIPAGSPPQAHAGTRVLQDVVFPAESPIVGRVRRTGCLIAGQSALTEWSGMRSTTTPSGWSAVDGQVGNPRVPGGSPWGSSSGSAAAVAAGWVRLGIGTDTSGSITLPAAAQGIVGFRPSRGRRDLSGTIGISADQDRPGYLTRDVTDLVTVWEALTGERVPPSHDPGRLAVLDFGAESYEQGQCDVWAAQLREVDWGIRTEDSASLQSFSASPAELDLLVDEFTHELARLTAAIGDQIDSPHPMDLLERLRDDPDERWDRVGGDIFEASCTRNPASPEQLAERRSELRRHAEELLNEALQRSGASALAFVIPLSAWRIEDSPFPWVDPPCTYPTVAPCIAGWPQICIPIANDGPPVGVVLALPPDRDVELLALARSVSRS